MRLSKLLILIIVIQVIADESDGFDTLNQNDEQAELLKKEQETKQKEQNIMIYSCVILTRYQFTKYDADLLQIVKNQKTPEDSTLVWKKIYTHHVTTCKANINKEQSVSIYSQLRDQSFDFNDYAPLFQNFSIEQYKTDSWPRDISEQDEQLWKFIELIKEFEDAMANNQQKQQQQVEDDQALKELEEQAKKVQEQLYDFEPKVFGLSIGLNKLKFLQIPILILVFSLIGFIIYLALQKLNKAEEQQKKKKKKNK